MNFLNKIEQAKHSRRMALLLKSKACELSDPIQIPKSAYETKVIEKMRDLKKALR